MKATDELKREHRVIEKVLSGLEGIANRANEAGMVECEPAERAIEMLRNFADKCHHGKEERNLFGVMQERGIPLERGPIGVMLAEHDEGRRHIRGMVESLPAAAQGERAAVDAFVEHAHSYVGLLRQHILKEDNVLYPMAERVLTSQDDERLVAAFEKIEREEMGEGTHEKYHKWAEEMERG